MSDQMRCGSRKFAAFLGDVLRIFIECLANYAGDIDALNQLKSVLKT
jgi:hypothetical protein